MSERKISSGESVDVRQLFLGLAPAAGGFATEGDAIKDG
jgi:hypothetical protein